MPSNNADAVPNLNCAVSNCALPLNVMVWFSLDWSVADVAASAPSNGSRRTTLLKYGSPLLFCTVGYARSGGVKADV